MTDKTPIRALIEAVEAGRMFQPESDKWAEFFPVNAAVYGPKIISAFYGSLDAALALHEALLPEWEWQYGFTVGGHGSYTATVWMTHEQDALWKVKFAKSTTPSRAWLLAILRAYEAQQ